MKNKYLCNFQKLLRAFLMGHSLNITKLAN